MKRSQITPWLGPPRGHRVSSQTVPVRLKCHVGRSLGKEHPVGADHATKTEKQSVRKRTGRS